MDLVTLRAASHPRCKICTSPQQVEIEEALLSPGTSLRAIGARFGLTMPCIHRHKSHMARAITTARALSEVESVGALYKRSLKRSATLWKKVESTLENPNATSFEVANAARLADVALKYEQALNKLAQAPGFRDAAPPTQINAPDARIVVTSSQREDLES
jgi:hypothetical protein